MQGLAIQIFFYDHTGDRKWSTSGNWAGGNKPYSNFNNAVDNFAYGDQYMDIGNDNLNLDHIQFRTYQNLILATSDLTLKRVVVSNSGNPNIALNGRKFTLYMTLYDGYQVFPFSVSGTGTFLIREDNANPGIRTLRLTSGAFRNGPTVQLQHTDLTLGNAGQGNYIVTGSTINIPGGSVTANAKISASVINLTGGDFFHLDSGSITSSTIDMTGGVLRNRASMNNTTVNVTGGEFTSTASMEKCDTHMSGSSVFKLDTYNSVISEYSGGTITLSETSKLYNKYNIANAGITVNSGTNAYSLGDISNTTITINGGTFQSNGKMKGVSANVTNGTMNIGYVALAGSTRVNESDVYTGGTINQSGGEIFNIRSMEGSTINITGGKYYHGRGKNANGTFFRSAGELMCPQNMYQLAC